MKPKTKQHHKQLKAENPQPISVNMERPPPGAGLSRRSLLNILWSVLGLAALAELVWIAVSFLRPSRQPADDAKGGTVVQAGAVDSFAPGSVTAFQRGQFYLVRMDNGGLLALSCKCTHLGCTVPWVEKEKKFLCPCHASAFDITGSVISAPAPRALDRFPVTIENHVIKVDTSRRIKRSGFESEQLVFPGKP
jgi:cytochrome b6-f complex iron-sulfur subunit